MKEAQGLAAQPALLSCSDFLHHSSCKPSFKRLSTSEENMLRLEMLLLKVHTHLIESKNNDARGGPA